MTTYQEFPLRPQDRPWPGLNTRGGRIDPGFGFLEDGSFNQVINEADILEKRRGFVRGLDERFTGPVCGLFRYTDNCGVEYLIVADGSDIYVRTPRSVPQLLNSDSLPFDDFEDLDTSKWTNTGVYEVSLGALQLDGTDSLGISDFTPATQLMQWFKPSVLSSYYVEVNYRLDASDDQQTVSVVTKRNESGTTYLEASIHIDGDEYELRLDLVNGGVRSTLNSQALGGAALADGFLRLSYNAGTFTATARAIPSGGNQVTIASPDGSISEAISAGLGQLSAVGLRRETLTVTPQIESVSGGQV